MRRRKFLTWLAVTAVWPLVWPLASTGQNRKRVVGILVAGSPDPSAFLRTFQEGLREMGYGELQLDIRSAEGKAERLPELATDLVRQKVDVIVAFQTPAVQAAKQATTEIPIVMDAGDPVGMGLVSSLARPGGNITGMAALTAELAPKALEYLREIVPSLRRLGLFLNATDPFSKTLLEHNRLAVDRLGLELQPRFISGPGELQSAFENAARQRVDALMIQPSLDQVRVAELALTHRLPAASLTSLFVRAGGLMSFSANYAELWREMAVYVVKILNGANPATLPVAQPTKFALIINLKTAKALGLQVPLQLQQLADELIE
jgi:putative tryptophan/tyrosine transport system substrate-binding protein